MNAYCPRLIDADVKPPHDTQAIDEWQAKEQSNPVGNQTQPQDVQVREGLPVRNTARHVQTKKV